MVSVGTISGQLGMFLEVMNVDCSFGLRPGFPIIVFSA
jgi:hypothetical protein